MALIRAILILAFAVHPLLLLPAVGACAPAARPGPACCGAECACAAGCGCSANAPAIPDRAPTTPAPAPRSGDHLLGVVLANSGVIGIVPPAPLRTPARPGANTHPYHSCTSVNALLCIWTT